MVSLRKLSLENAEQIALLLNNINVNKYLRDIVPFPYSVTDAINFINHSNEKYNFAIYKDETLVGIISIEPQDDIFQFNFEIGYWIGEPFWGKGIATQAIGLITEYAFSNFDCSRIFAMIMEENIASIRALSKNNYLQEGILKKAIFKQNAYHNAVLMARLRS